MCSDKRFLSLPIEEFQRSNVAMGSKPCETGLCRLGREAFVAKSFACMDVA